MKFVNCRTLGTALALYLVLNFPSLAAPSHVVYVNKNASGAAHDGSSWSTAFLTIQAAIDAAVTGDELWVAVSPPASPAYVGTVSVPKSISLYGGFDGTETKRAQRDWKRNITILDGSKSGPVVTLGPTTSQPIVLDGFTIQNGQQAGYGGGVYVSAPAAFVSNNTIVDNLDYGILEYSGNVTITGNSVSRNAGAGLVLHANATVSNNTISGNNYDGVYAGTAINLTNNTICGNSGCGLNLTGGTHSATNNVVAFNGAYGVLKVASASVAVFSHNDVYGNRIGEFSGYTPPTDLGNQSTDPMLSCRYHTVHLQPGSPCIDSGDDSAVKAGDVDAYGKPRITGPHVDIGADESDGVSWVVPVRTLHVSPTGDDNSDGLTWSRAKRTLKSALAVAQYPFEVWVSAGTYRETISIPAGVAVYGGFVGSESERSARNPAANPTILDGAGGQTVVTCGFLEAVLDGFTVRNGVLGVVVGGSASLTAIIVTGNTGGAVRVARGALTMTRCDVSNNGGTLAVFVSPGSAVLTANSIRGNTGDGVYVQNDSFSSPNQSVATLRDNMVAGNGGRGLVVTTNCRMSSTGDSVCGNKGEGLYLLTGGAIAIVRNTIIAYNSGNGVAGATTITMPLFSYNDVYGNAGLTGDALPSTAVHCLKLDPRFVDRANGDYHPSAGSPCIDAGDDSAVTPGESDLDGKPRKLGPHVDIGAYEFAHAGFYTMADVAPAIRIAAGLGASPGDISRWDVSGNPGVDLLDAVAISRKAAGLEQNP